MKDLINWLNFRNMITPMIIKGWFWILTGLFALAALFTVLGAASSTFQSDIGVFEVWGTAIAVDIVLVFLWTLARISTEFVLVIFSIHDELKEMNDGNQ